DLSSFCFQAEDGIRDRNVTGVQTCALPICARRTRRRQERRLMSTTLPKKLEDIVAEFDAVGDQERLQLLLELADELPELPSRYRSEERRVGKECGSRWGACR